MTAIQITIRIPSTAQIQQAAGHWSGRNNERGGLRRTARILTLRAMNCGPGFKAASLDIAIFYPDKRRRDWPNNVASLKPVIDGMMDAGALPDDDWQHMPPGAITVGIDKANPRIVLTLKPLPMSDHETRISDPTDRAEHETALHNARSIASALPSASESARIEAKMAAFEASQADPRALPAGKTCADCMHFKRCEPTKQTGAGNESCIYLPSRFRLPLPLAK